MEETLRTLGVMLAEVDHRDSYLDGPFYVSFEGIRFQRLLEIDGAVKRMRPQEKSAFLHRLLKLLLAPYEAGHLHELREALGDALTGLIGRRLIFTLTADGKELRAWRNPPMYVVAKSGKPPVYVEGLFFLLWGSPEGVTRAMEYILPDDYFKHPIQLPNGAQLYGMVCL